MGCRCSKASVIEDSNESPQERVSSKSSARQIVTPLKRDEFFENEGNKGEVIVRFPVKQGNGLLHIYGEETTERKRERNNQHGGQRIAYAVNPHPRIGSIPRDAEGEQVAAGWPSWLSAVAGEAIRGWIPRRADSFEKLDKIGQGTYSNVYKARDLENGKIVALKKVRFDNLEPESVRFMAREIHILRRLDHPNVIKLEGLVTSRMSCSLYLVFEYMEHDLAGLASTPGLKFTEPQVKCYMQQLLSGLDHCHSRGVLHRDIKGSNLLIDNSGTLKIADFGLATFFSLDQRQPLTSRVVTLWYRPPELLLGATEYGVAVDLWSTGCILAELFACKPILPGRTEVEQLHKIFKLCGSPSEEYWRKSKLPHATIFKPQQPYRRSVLETFKDFPPPALGLMDVLLAIDPADRGTAAFALKSEFFTTKPFACDPSTLPKYPPSKEFDMKMRDEEARRQRAAGGKMHKYDMPRRGPRESRAVPAPDANAELAISIQKRQSQSNSKSMSEKFNHQQEEIASGFPIDPPCQAPIFGEPCGPSQGNHHVIRNGFSHSGPLVHPMPWAKKEREEDWAKKDREDDYPQKLLVGSDLSALSGLVAVRKNGRSDNPRETGVFQPPRYVDARAELVDSCKAIPISHQKRDKKVGDKDKLLGHGLKGNKIHYSGPLLPPSGNMDQMLKDHERHIQEAFRRTRLGRAKLQRPQADG
ncbi:hypothetical protein AMTRI_Chr01g112000 [Amborella trichopoda]|uniref:Protein kinase domain-containing protein n=1 Tax=Amborella trichopoda TaxID=13333 RepID=U5DD83_AMBTC|nr:probable serine/threonine-protein kinase At1g54610 [Amborella trichopoda]ERN20499.1 hypothetical protein AMTR_s00068p00177220 [Amborella trichopoda]|eukprot:XP_020532105.1 probable serine/threonine-protein kinase At1g54610 [Amborella trichopoda]